MSEEIQNVTREVRNSSGVVIAYVTLPANTPESKWNSVISGFICTEDLNSAISLIQSQDAQDGEVTAEEEETFWQRVMSYLFG